MGMEHHHEARARSGGAPEQQTQQRTERFWLGLLLLGRPGQCFPRVHLWLLPPLLRLRLRLRTEIDQDHESLGERPPTCTRLISLLNN
jgi:hypothetical protein